MEILQDAKVTIRFIYDRIGMKLNQELIYEEFHDYENNAKNQGDFWFMEKPIDTITEYGVEKLAKYWSEEHMFSRKKKARFTERLLVALEENLFPDVIVEDYENLSGFEDTYEFLKNMERTC